MPKTINSRLIPLPSSNDQRDELIAEKSKSSKLKIGLALIIISALLKDCAITAVNVGASSKPPAVVVTKGNGEQESLSFQTGLDRSPELIRSFAISSMSNLHSWRNTGEGGVPDEGIRLKSGKTLPTSVYNQMVVLDPLFAEKYQSTLAQMIESSQLASERVQVLYQIESTSDLVKMADGKYQIKVIGNLIKASPTSEREKIAFNRLVLMKAIPPFLQSETAKKTALTDKKGFDLLRLKQLETAKGLMITDIKTLE